MSSSSSSHDSSSNEWTSSSSDEEMLFDEMHQEVMFFQCALNALNSENLLNDHDEGEFGEFIDWVARVQDVLATMQQTTPLFKNLTNFTLMEFEELTS
jgi:hypothetical protein